MEKEQISKEILNSNLSDDAKVELFKLLFSQPTQQVCYYPITTDRFKPDPEWLKITCCQKQ